MPGSSLPLIIHVTESFAGGTASAIVDYVRAAPERRHRLVYASRPGEPVSPDMLAIFEHIVSLPRGHVRRILFLRRLLAKERGVIVHSHSSLAGTYVRAAMPKKHHRPLVHTPHCFAFERTDVSRLRRGVYETVERILAINTSLFVVCSFRENDLARRLNSSVTSVFVPNAVDALEREQTQDTPSAHALPFADNKDALVVLAAGRLSAQKDPAFLIAALESASALGLHVKVVWIGAGPEAHLRRMQRSGVTVTGWITRAEARQHMKSADVYVHTAAWEGFPLTLLEAVAEGLPVVVRGIPAFDHVPLPAKVETPAEMAQTLCALVNQRERERVRLGSRLALARNTTASQSHALNSAYAILDSALASQGPRRTPSLSTKVAS